MSEKSVTCPRREEASPPQGQPEERQELQGSVSSSCSSSKPAKHPLFVNSGEDDDDDNTQGKEKKLKKDILGGVKDDENAEEDQKISFLERLSSNIETEIEFFNQILAFHSEKKKYPFSDSASFNDFYKNHFLEDTPASLLMEAIQNLKRKYQRMTVKGREKLSHYQPNNLEALAFELAKAIWNDIDDSRVEKSVNEEKFIGGGKVSVYPYLNESLKLQKKISNETTLKGLASIGSLKIKELDGKWKNFWEQQMQLTLKQNELKLRQKELILEQEKLFTDAI